MYVVVGLGNPGQQYAQTRHNIGHMVIAELTRRYGVALSNHKQTHTQAASVRVGVAPGQQGEQVILATSHSYMNTSGGPVSSLLKYYGATAENLIVVHDELDLEFGALRMKRGGGEGGHNGLKSISASLGTKDYIRVRCGIGRPPGRQDPADFVLGTFTSKERSESDVMIVDAADAVIDVIMNGLEPATMRLHTAQRTAGK